jgi:hypothetical protein
MAHKGWTGPGNQLPTVSTPIGGTRHVPFVPLQQRHSSGAKASRSQLRSHQAGSGRRARALGQPGAVTTVTGRLNFRSTR